MLELIVRCRKEHAGWEFRAPMSVTAWLRGENEKGKAGAEQVMP
jgi:hypothetical protein